jgi:alkanesulfonate monooxygenase SsuD/methylene tetrahydromethanopterin reductase-like flavin-dependent oxidoreductase (luciferase family)
MIWKTTTLNRNETMEDSQQAPQSRVLVDTDLQCADRIIEELDDLIQHTGNLELSKTLNEISESYESIRSLLNRKRQ